MEYARFGPEDDEGWVRRPYHQFVWKSVDEADIPVEDLAELARKAARVKSFELDGYDAAERAKAREEAENRKAEEPDDWNEEDFV